jgi:hypothetical protein
VAWPKFKNDPKIRFRPLGVNIIVQIANYFFGIVWTLTMPRKEAKQEALEAVEEIFATEIVNCILETNYDSELDLFMSSTKTFGSEDFSSTSSSKSDPINVFYRCSFKDTNIETTSYLTNDEVFDKLTILLELEYHWYLTPRDPVFRSQDFYARCITQQSFEQFQHLFGMNPDAFERILGMIVDHDVFPNNSAVL